MVAAGFYEKPAPPEEQLREECHIPKYHLLFEWLNNMCVTHSYSEFQHQCAGFMHVLISLI